MYTDKQINHAVKTGLIALAMSIGIALASISVAAAIGMHLI